MNDSAADLVYILVGAEWPKDGNLSNLKPGPMAIMPQDPERKLVARGTQSTGSGYHTEATVIVAIVFAAVMMGAVLALVADGVWTRRRGAAADVEARDRPDGAAPDAQMPPNQPAAGENMTAGENVAPAAQPPRDQRAANERPRPSERRRANARPAQVQPMTAQWNQLGKFTTWTVTLLIVVPQVVWCFYNLVFSLSRLEPYFQAFLPHSEEYLRRNHVFQAMCVLKFICNLHLLAAVLFPNPFWLEARIYRVFSALLALAYSILAVLTLVYLDTWASWFRGTGEYDMGTICAVGFWSEFGYLVTCTVVVMVVLAVNKLL